MLLGGRSPSSQSSCGGQGVSQKWEKATATPICKKVLKEYLGNYWLISVISVPGEIREWIPLEALSGQIKHMIGKTSMDSLRANIACQLDHFLQPALLMWAGQQTSTDCIVPRLLIQFPPVSSLRSWCVRIWTNGPSSGWGTSQQPAFRMWWEVAPQPGTSGVHRDQCWGLTLVIVIITDVKDGIKCTLRSFQMKSVSRCGCGESHLFSLHLLLGRETNWLNARHCSQKWV